MALADLQVDRVTADDIRALPAERVSEDLRLEYKESLPGNSDRDKLEFLRDIVAFANRAGGLIVYGIEEKDSVAHAVCGVECEDYGAAVTRLDNIARTGISPGLPSLRSVWLAVDDKHVVLARIGRSWRRPHAVTADGRMDFYIRHSNSKGPMDMSELRAQFTSADDITSRLHAFHDRRLSVIRDKRRPRSMATEDCLVLHLVPFESVAGASRLDVASMIAAIEKGMGPQLYGPFQSRPNFDGLMCERASSPTHVDRYIQWFRTGAIEYVQSGIVRSESENKVLWSGMDSYVIKLVETHRHLLISCGIDPPIAVFLSLLGVKNARLGVADDSPFPRSSSGKIDRLELSMSAVVETWEEDLRDALRPLFDPLWNAVGLRSWQ